MSATSREARQLYDNLKRLVLLACETAPVLEVWFSHAAFLYLSEFSEVRFTPYEVGHEPGVQPETIWFWRGIRIKVLNQQPLFIVWTRYEPHA